jgi:hypothetical protein
VLFPAPLGPKKPNTSPFKTFKLRLLTATIDLKRLFRFEISITLFEVFN